MQGTGINAKRLTGWAITIATTAIIAIGGTATAAGAATSTAAAPAKATATGLVDGDRLVIPSIKFDKTVVEGWTREINQGKITLVGNCWPGTPRTATLPCSTTWIAGHYSTHGSPFRDLPKVKIGDLVQISHAGVVTTYRITSKQIVDRAKPPTEIFHQDLLLQCSHGAKQAWAINATIVP